LISQVVTCLANGSHSSQVATFSTNKSHYTQDDQLDLRHADRGGRTAETYEKSERSKGEARKIQHVGIVVVHGAVTKYDACMRAASETTLPSSYPAPSNDVLLVHRLHRRDTVPSAKYRARTMVVVSQTPDSIVLVFCWTTVGVVLSTYNGLSQQPSIPAAAECEPRVV